MLAVRSWLSLHGAIGTVETALFPSRDRARLVQSKAGVPGSSED